MRITKIFNKIYNVLSQSKNNSTDLLKKEINKPFTFQFSADGELKTTETEYMDHIVKGINKFLKHK